MSAALAEPEVKEIKLSFIPAAQDASDLFLMLGTRSSEAGPLVERFASITPALRVSAVDNLFARNGPLKPTAHNTRPSRLLPP